MILKKIALIATLVSTFILSACDNGKKAEVETGSPASSSIKVGVINGPDQEVAEVVKQQAKHLYNLDVELVIFNDYVTPNQALNDGLIDINVFQHVPYLEQQIKDRGYDLAIVANTFVYPIASYSNKLKPISDENEIGQGIKVISPRNEVYFIPAGANIAVPNDPTNLGRALLLLQKQGMITVDPTKGLLPTTVDITSNPYNFHIIELEAPMLPRSLNDAQVDLAIINNTFAGQVNLSPSKDGIFAEDNDSPYMNIIVSRTDNKDDEKVATFIKAYQTDATVHKTEELYKGAVKGW
ncbi:MAG: methionine ABC transporter membrane-anchored lipoprotein MetQ [Candidatus Schmidhempelia sp.]|nr:methionine ABC transporter membrane-anchored lipoprotein MetQ [Candidatus Schmidhempelia sp.]